MNINLAPSLDPKKLALRLQVDLKDSEKARAQINGQLHIEELLLRSNQSNHKPEATVLLKCVMLRAILQLDTLLLDMLLLCASVNKSWNFEVIECWKLMLEVTVKLRSKVTVMLNCEWG